MFDQNKLIQILITVIDRHWLMDYFVLFRVISDYPTKIDIEVINGIKLDNDWLVQQDKRFMIFCKAWNLLKFRITTPSNFSLRNTQSEVSSQFVKKVTNFENTKVIPSSGWWQSKAISQNICKFIFRHGTDLGTIHRQGHCRILLIYWPWHQRSWPC